MKRNQKGFGIVEVFLIVIILLAIGLVGLKIYNAKKLTVAMPYIGNSSNSTKLDNSLTDILPVEPEGKGDIPDFVAKLRQAKGTKDISICNSLPDPQHQDFFFGDYSLSSPPRSEWVGYCTALVKNDPVLCKSITGYSHPNLQEDCLEILEKEAQRNADYTFCYNKFGSLYTSSDELRNCFLVYKKQLASAPAFYQSLNVCLQKSQAPANSIGSKRDGCLFSLALSSKNQKVCNIIDTPYSAYKYGRPNCITALQNSR